MAIIAFQETHLDDNTIKRLKFIWKYKYSYSNGTNKQAGLLMLYNQWELISESE